MRFVYPAIFRKTESGSYKGYFPDLESCTVVGKTLEDAVDLANDAAREWITVELEEEGALPPISDECDMQLEEGDVVRNIAVTIRFHVGWDE